MTENDMSLAEYVRLLQEMVDEGTVAVKIGNDDDVLKNKYVITEFGAWLIETGSMAEFQQGDHVIKEIFRVQYEKSKRQ
jgi:hypothetical protein